LKALMHLARHAGSPRTALLTGLLSVVLLVAPRSVAAAAPGVGEDVPVPGGTAALAKALEIEPVPDRARFVAELVRIIYDDTKQRRTNARSKFRLLIAYLETIDRQDSASKRGNTVLVDAQFERVPVPLPAVVWSEVLRRPVDPAQLFATVMSDAAAAFLVHGLAALDEETLQFFVDHPAAVRQLYERGAPAFATFAAHLQIRANRVVVPGGDQAVPLWEALVGEKAGRPAAFVVHLFTRDEGRLAYLYDTIGSLNPSRASFALGVWIADARARLDRFRALGSAVAAMGDDVWTDRSPFKRAPHDLVSMLLRVEPQPTGAPAAPAWRAWWARAFDSSEASGDVATLRATPARGDVIDAAWLAETLLQGDGSSRSDRLDRFAFGQRALALNDPADWPDALFVLRSFPSVRMLMLTLERIGVRRPALYAALTRLAEQISALETTRARVALANMQGAIALVERLVRVRSIDTSTAERLLEALARVPFKDERGFVGGLAPWLQFELRPTLRRDGAFKEILVDALAGSTDDASIAPVSWEGQQYRLDIAATERQRLHRAGARDAAHAIDLAVTLYGLAQRLATDTAAATEIQSTLVALNQPAALSSDSRPALESLLSVVDVVVGDALLALNYQVNLNLARGTPRAAAAVARRHDFGFDIMNHEARVRAPWELPKRVVRPSVPWYLVGAALGLDVAAPSLALRRIDTAAPSRSPVLDGNEVVTFAMSVALMDPRAMRNDSLETIAGAIARGRHQVEALVSGDGDVNAVARAIAMDGWRVRALRWTLRHEPERAPSWFSMTELLYLGGGRGIDLHAWGMSALDLAGCLCARLTDPGLRMALVGRVEPRLLIATVADLHLQVAVALSEMRLPAALAKPVLEFAVRDFLDRALSLHLDDWLTRVRAAQSLSYQQIEDYVSAVVVGGPMVPDTIPEQSRVP
jgi:hypothetical protein